MKEKKNVLVVGGTGFIGGHLVEELDKSEVVGDVVAYDVSVGCYRYIKDKCTFEKGDICNKAHLSTVMSEYDIDIIYNLAGISHTVSSAKGLGRTYRAGIYGFSKMLDVLSQGDYDVDRVLIASSSLTSGIMKRTEDMVGSQSYSDKYIKSDETVLDTERSYHPYVSNKLAMEMALRDHNEMYGTPFTIMRYGTTYGPRMARGVVTWYFIRAALEGGKIMVEGDGEQWRQHFYVKDNVEGQVKAIEQDHSKNEVISLAPSWKTTVNEIAETIQELRPEVEIEYTDPREHQVKVEYIDTDKTTDMLNWSADTDLKEGLRKTIEWYEENRSWLK